MEGKSNLPNSSDGIEVSRRQIMHSAGAAATGSTLLTSKVSGVPAGQTREYDGVSYDPLTHEFQRVAHGKIQTSEYGIEGTLEVGGFTVPLTGLSDESVQHYTSSHLGVEQYSFVDKTTGDWGRGTPLQLNFLFYGHGLGGTLARDGGKSGKLAFTLRDMESGSNWETLRNSLTGGGDGKPGITNKDIPDKGIPGRRSAFNEATDNE